MLQEGESHLHINISLTPDCPPALTNKQHTCPHAAPVHSGFRLTGCTGSCLVRYLGGLEQQAGGAASQRGALAVEVEAVAVRRARADRQQVVVAGDVAVPGQVVRILRVTGNHHTSSSLDDTDGRLCWRKRRPRLCFLQQQNSQ